uniref:Uncharacterized protein n=1 Tax=Octopus bimaculoides TaxID=37653 RepID=A0A0L8GSP5_OCTBM
MSVYKQLVLKLYATSRLVTHTHTHTEFLSQLLHVCIHPDVKQSNNKPLLSCNHANTHFTH